MSDSITLDDMSKKQIRTVPVHARLAESDVAVIDEAAEQQPIAVSRSHMIALIVRQWINALHGGAKLGGAKPSTASQGTASSKRRRSPK